MNATVLFADVSGAAISNCIEPLRKAAESAGGRVVKLVGDEVMVLFATPDAAAKAAVKMHQCIESLPAAAGDEPALRVAFHSGPVIQVDKDVLGDTVKLAARLVAQAQRGQTITTGQTAAQLSTGLRAFSRDLQRVALTDRSETIRLCEILTTSLNGAARARETKARTMVRLAYADQMVVCSRENHPRIVIGRARACDLVIADKLASRQHCTLEARDDEFFLLDHSTNGTYVTVEGEHEILLNGEGFAQLHRPASGGHRGARRCVAGTCARFRSGIHCGPRDRLGGGSEVSGGRNLAAAADRRKGTRDGRNRRQRHRTTYLSRHRFPS